MSRPGETVVYVPGEDDENDAAEVALGNIDDELRAIEGLRVTVSKIVGAPNDPMAHCFTQPASNFQTLDDLREYIGREYGEGQYRAYYKVGGKIKRNVALNIARRQHRETAAPTPAPTGGSEVSAVLAYMRERDEKRDEREARLLERLTTQQQQPAIDPLQYLKTAVEAIKPLMGESGRRGGSGFAEMREFMEFRRDLKEELREEGGGGEPTTGAVISGLVRDLAPAVIGFLSQSGGRRGAPSLAAPPGADSTSTGTPPAAPINDEAAMLQSIAPYLKMLDSHARQDHDTGTYAGLIVDSVPDRAALRKFLGDPDPIGELIKVYPPIADTRAWWERLLADVREELVDDEPHSASH